MKIEIEADVTAVADMVQAVHQAQMSERVRHKKMLMQQMLSQMVGGNWRVAGTRVDCCYQWIFVSHVQPLPSTSARREVQQSKGGRGHMKGQVQCSRQVQRTLRKPVHQLHMKHLRSYALPPNMAILL